MTLGSAFLVALAFTGLQPLWSTRFAASILLWSVTVTLILINAAYKDGDEVNRPFLAVRWAGRVAGPMMLTLTLLAIYAIAQRVVQYGWTPGRVRSCAVAFVALTYSSGYTWASVMRGPWLQRLEKVNVVASLVILGILALLLSPVADPARLAVIDQVSRLKSGAIAPAKFDYELLRFGGGRYGQNALAALTTSPNVDIRSRARLAQANSQKRFILSAGPDPASTEPALAHVTVYPHGAKLPADFAARNLSEDMTYAASCLRDGSPCDIIVWDSMAHDGPLLIVHQSERGDIGNSVKSTPQNTAALDIAGSAPLEVFGRDTNGKWSIVGHIDHGGCPGIVDALRKGEGKSIRPTHDDIEVAGNRLTFNPNAAGACPAQLPAQVRASRTRANDATAPAHMGPAFGNPGTM